MIYRYFGGLDGLFGSLGEANMIFIHLPYSEFAGQIAQVTTANLKDIIKTILLKQLEYLKDSHLMQELYVWELSGKSSFRTIQAEREKNGHKLQLELEKRLGKTCHNCNFYITVIIAAINYIILFTRQYNMFNGIDFSQPEAWEELKNIISDYIDTFLIIKNQMKTVIFYSSTYNGNTLKISRKHSSNSFCRLDSNRNQNIRF